MTRVRDIMSSELVVVNSDLDLRALVELLAEKHIGGVPVLDGREVVGVISTDDVLGFLSSEPTVPKTRPTDMDYELEDEEGVAEAVEGAEAPGAYFADHWSDAGAEVVERFAAPGTPEWDLLGEHTVAEAMTRRVLSVKPAAEVTEAARLMHDAGVHRLLVMEGETLVGIITTSDITGQVAAEGALRAWR